MKVINENLIVQLLSVVSLICGRDGKETCRQGLDGQQRFIS